MFDSTENGRYFIIISLSTVPGKQSSCGTEIMCHLNQLRCAVGFGSLKSCIWEERIAEIDGVLVGVITIG